MSIEDLDETLRDQFFSRMVIDKTHDFVEHIVYLPNEYVSIAHAFPWFMTTQSLIRGFGIEANRISISLKGGTDPAECIPGLRPVQFKEIRVEGDMIKLVMEGVGGLHSFLPMILAGASKIESYTSALKTRNVKKDEVLTCIAHYPILHKVTIGLDDTDTASVGDTYLSALNIGHQIASEGYGYFLRLAVTLNYPLNPFKTTNNCSSALVFLVAPHRERELIDVVIDKIHAISNSRETGIAIHHGLAISPLLKKYTRDCKSKMLSVNYTEKVAESIGTRLASFEGDRGKIGALSSLGYANEPLKAIAPSRKFRMLFRLGKLYVSMKHWFQ